MQSHFQAWVSRARRRLLEQSGNGLCLAEAELSGGDFPQDLFQRFGELFGVTDLQWPGLYRTVFGASQQVGQKRAQQCGIPLQGQHESLVYDGLPVFVEQLLAPRATLVPTAARAAAAELISWLEGPAPFHRSPPAAREPRASNSRVDAKPAQ